VRPVTECDRLIFDGKGDICGIQITDRATGKTEILTAERYVLCAGAVGSPVILLNSQIGDRSGQLGRNYMYHAGALVVGIFPGKAGGTERFVKQLGFTDLYLGAENYPHKLGYAQMLPVPGYLTFRQLAPFHVPRALAKVALDRMILWSGSVEDLPLPDNRITVSTSGAIEVKHRFHDYDLERSKYFYKKLKGIFKAAGALASLGGLADQSDTHTAHQVGTARFGSDPSTSVLDVNCRFHGYDNLFVVDGCFMPTSLGVAPALTIMANALRIGDIIKQEI
jgi:choline dehydrogenase-like flavoprotein